MTDDPKYACGCCGGSGWVVRDPDIGIDQECFCCDGTGVNPDAESDDNERSNER